jgi:hypothetical protein
MNQYLTQFEAFMRRRGIVMPRIYLLSVLSVLAGLLALLYIPSCREFLATVVLHDWFVVCVVTIVGPLFLCDPSRARTPFWAAIHLICLSGSVVLAFFFLAFCDLAIRDDRAYLSLLACFASVLAGRAFVADLLITAIARSLATAPTGRAHLLSAYARMLDVDPARAKLPPPVLGARLVLSVRERCQRILGLRRTRSRAIEVEFRFIADRLGAECDAQPSEASFVRYASAMTHEIALHRIILAARMSGAKDSEIGGRDVSERWPSEFYNRWSLLLKTFLRLSSRVRGEASEAFVLGLRAKVLIPLLEDSKDIMLIVHRDDPAGGKEMQTAVSRYASDAKVSPRDLRSDFDRHVLGFRKPAFVSRKSQFAFLLTAQLAAEHLPLEFASVYGSEKAGALEWKKSGLSQTQLALCLTVALRRQLQSGGLSEAQKGPVVARLLMASAQAGFKSKDYPETAWADLMQASPLQWENFAKGLEAFECPPTVTLSDDAEPGVGRISVTNAFASLVVALTALFLMLSSPFWLSPKKPFNDLFGPYERAHSTARSIDLSSDGSNVAVATAQQGLLTIDVRNYGVRRTGIPDGLSSNELTDVVALSDGSFVAATEGLYGAKGLDFVREGRGAPIIGLPSDDHSALTADPPLTMVNVGKDALFVFSRGLLYYDASRRVLVSVPGSPSEIVAACGSKRVDGRAWLLHKKDGKMAVSEIKPRDEGVFSFHTFDHDPQVAPSRIFHDGVNLWCLDADRSNIHMRMDDKWVLKAGSPNGAKEGGGLATAESLAISRRPEGAFNDALWMLKGGKVFVRTIPRDPLQAELPMPWIEVAAVEEGYLGEIHAFCVDDVGYLIVPYRNRIDLLTHRNPAASASRRMQLPKPDSILRSIHIGSSQVVLATADGEQSEVRLIGLRDFVGLALHTIRPDWPSPVQASAYLSADFSLEDVVGVCKSGNLTYQFDSAGRWLKHDKGRHGLVNTGRDVLRLEMSDDVLGKTKGFKVSDVSQSGDAAKFLLSSNLGVYEMALDSLGVSAAKSFALLPMSPLMPDGGAMPIGLSDTITGPEVYFQEPKGDSQPLDAPRLATIWRLQNHLRQDSHWARQAPGRADARIYVDSLLRARIDREDGSLSFGPIVAMNDARSLVFRGMADDVWRSSSFQGQWTNIVNVSDGGTVIRQRGGDKHDGDVIRISQVIPSSSGLQERPLWRPSSAVPRGGLPSPDAVAPVAGRGFVFPTAESFWSYDPMTRSWDKIMDRAPGDQVGYRILSDDIRAASGASNIVWWADGSHNLYALSSDKAAMFAKVGDLAAGAASGQAYVSTNENNALFAFSLRDGSTRRLFAPVKPEGGRSGVAMMEECEAGIAFLPTGGGKVLTLDDDDQFVSVNGPSFGVIANVDSRLLGIADIKGESRLVGVFAGGAGVGKGLNGLHSLGDMAMMTSYSGDMWMAGFSGGALHARIIGDVRSGESPASAAKAVAAYSYAGQLILSVDGGIHHRPDSPAQDERPGFARIAWSGADWFRPIGTLGKVAPAGGLGCYSLTNKLDFSLITREAGAGFRITNGLDVPVFVPEGGASSVFKVAAGGKLTPYDGSEGKVFGGGSTLGARSRVHPLDAGLLVLSRAYGAGIGFYDASTGVDSMLGFIKAEDGARIGCPFGTDVDFMYASDSPDVLPFIRDGRVLGRVSRTHGDVEVISERAISPVIMTGQLRWLDSGHLFGAGPLGGMTLSKTELPSLSRSRKGVVSGLLHLKSDAKFAMSIDGALVSVDLGTDKFTKHGRADVLFSRPGGVVAATVQSEGHYSLSEGTVALPAPLRELGPVKLAVSPGHLAVFKTKAPGGKTWIKGVANASEESFDFSLRTSPAKDLVLASGSTIVLGRHVTHVEHDRLYRYDLDRGEWSEPGLPSSFMASSIRKGRDGRLYLVDERNADVISLGSDGLPTGSVQRGLAMGVSLSGSLVQVKADTTGKIGVRSGANVISSEMDAWMRTKFAFTEQSSTYSLGQDATLSFSSPGAKAAVLHVRSKGRLNEFELPLPAKLADLEFFEGTEGFVVSDSSTFILRMSISDEGDVSMAVSAYDYSYLGKAVKPDRYPRGWIKIAGRYLHESGYVSGQVPVSDHPLRIESGRLVVTTRNVVNDGASEELIPVSIDCAKAAEMSLVHPDFAKLLASESAVLLQDHLYSDFNGQKIRLLRRKVISDEPAEVDDIRHLGVLGSSVAVVLDAQGGVWRRDLISGARTYLGKAGQGARLVYFKPAGGDVMAIALEDGGIRRLLQADGTIGVLQPPEGQYAASPDRMSIAVDRLKATCLSDGFTFMLASRYALSASSDGWIIDGADPEPVLGVRSGDSLMLRFSQTKDPGKALLHVPAEGERRMLRAELAEESDFKGSTAIKTIRSGGYTFDWLSGALVVRHEGISKPIDFIPGGGLESDRHRHAATLSEDGRHCLISISSHAGRVFARDWINGGLGPLMEVDLGPAQGRADMVLSVDGKAYVRAGSAWFVMGFNSGGVSATKMDESPLRRFGEMPKDTGAPWAFERGKIFASTGSGWENVPCRSDPVALACDLPSASFDDYRALPSGRIAYKSRMNDDSKPIWYVIGLEGGIPRRHESPLPARYFPAETIRRSDSLGNSMVFTRSKNDSYSLMAKSLPEQKISLSLEKGARLPHLGVFANPKPSAGAIFFEAGRSSLQAQLYLKVPDDSGKPELILDMPAPAVLVRPQAKSEWWIKEGKVSVSWSSSQGLVLGVTMPDGALKSARIGSYAEGKPFEIDDASRICLRSARSKTISFSTYSSLRSVLIMPAGEHSSLANTLSLYELAEESFAGDVFLAQASFLADEMRPVDPSTGSFPRDRFSCSLLPGSRIEVRPGLSIPLHKSEQLNGWTTPQGDPVAAVRLTGGELLLQSCRGAWVSFYGAGGELSSGRYIDEVGSFRLRWADESHKEVVLQSGDSVRLLELPSLSDGSTTERHQTYAVEGGLSFVRSEAGLFRCDLGALALKAGVYPSVDFTAVSLTEDVVTLEDAYGVRNLASGAFTSVTEGRVFRPKLNQAPESPLPMNRNCGAWKLICKDGKFDALKGGDSVLDPQGVPYVDKVLGFDGYEQNLMFVNKDRLVLVASSTVLDSVKWGSGPGMIESSVLPDVRFAVSDENLRTLVDFGKMEASAYDMERRVLVQAEACHRPAGVLSGTETEFLSNKSGEFEMRLTLREGDRGPALISYLGPEVIRHNQLASDRVLAVKSEGGDLFVRHASSSGNHSGWLEFIPSKGNLALRSCRGRDGPSLRVDAPGSYLRPWSETRVWGVDSGKVFWEEASMRWGD